MKKGDKVTILTSSHSDIQPGMQGVIESEFNRGFSVTVTGQFGLGSDRKEETRIIWFPKKALTKNS